MCYYYLSLENMTSKQCLKIKSSIIDANNHLNGTFPSLNTLNSKFSTRIRLIDSFSSCFSFYIVNCKDKESKNAYFWKLNKIIFKVSSKANSVIIISDASIKDNIATSIAHVYSCSNPIKKTLHHTINITMTKAELVKLLNFLTLSVSSLLLTLSMWLKESLIPSLIFINYNWLLFQKTSDHISINILIILLNSGIAQVMISGYFMYWLTMT